MADARDFLPEAGPPPAEKSPTDIQLMEIRSQPAAYVISGDDGAYLYKGSTRDLAARWTEHAAGLRPPNPVSSPAKTGLRRVF